MTHPIHKNNTLYFESVSKYPYDYRGVKWASHESQFLRFKILCKIADNIFHSRILDVGCGLGHLPDYLISQQFSGIYKGIDLVDQMIIGARKRHPSYDFETNDIDSIPLSSYDYVLASGLFPFVDWQNMQEIIKNLITRAKQGVAFNCLSAFTNHKEKNQNKEIFYPHPTDVFNFCQTLTPKLTLRHDYLENDFTVYMYK
jgi:2-polyprenyl-3-methyl-5-hydroxy-6-metoxy-1,4-benzoquinol methylase